MQAPSVREVHRRSILHEMEGSRDYTANFYRGCTHGCAYCYVPSLIHDERRWGWYVDAKVNSPSVLDRELRKVRKGVVFLSSASDPYQPVEAKYGITRKALEVLARRGFPTVILTRSPLVLRDLDILRRMSWVRVGMSISSIPGRTYEPGVAPVERRVQTLRRLEEEGLKTWVSMAPIVPGMAPFDADALLRSLKEAGVSSVTAGILRIQGYEESRKMFEEATGVSAGGLISGGEVLIAEVRRKIAANGFEPAESFFAWRADEETPVPPGGDIVQATLT